MKLLRWACLAAFGGGVLGWFTSARAATLNLLPSNQISGTGSPVGVALSISGLGDFTSPALGTYDVTIGFDPTALTFQSVFFGDPVLGDQLDLLGLGDIQTFNHTVGALELFELSLDSPSDLAALQPGSFTLAMITFDTLASTNSQLTLSINALGDENGNSLLTTPEPRMGVPLVFGGMVIVGLFRWKSWRKRVATNSSTADHLLALELP